MILCVGEILTDKIVIKGETSSFAGGAPFNVACNACFEGADVGFAGRVGRDEEGRFLIDFAEKIGFASLQIKEDDRRRTTVALVEVSDDGEREFRFLRDDTADYNMDIADINFDVLKAGDIVHLGSLMLSEEKGRDFAKKVVDEVKRRGLKLSFDINFRTDIYDSFESAIATNSYFVENADILKFSEDEILAFTGKDTLEDAIKALKTPDNLIALTLGKRGSMFVFDDDVVEVPSLLDIVRVDTTGCGDAFYGTLLANIDKVGFDNLTRENLEKMFGRANDIGAYCATKKGAINRF